VWFQYIGDMCVRTGDTYLKGFPVDMARYLVEAHVLGVVPLAS
jgi:hypothetical protein